MYKAKWWLNHNQGWFQSRKIMIQRRILMNLLKKHGLAKKDDDVTNKTDDKHDGLIMIRKIYNDPNYEFDPEDHY